MLHRYKKLLLSILSVSVVSYGMWWYIFSSSVIVYSKNQSNTIPSPRTTLKPTVTTQRINTSSVPDHSYNDTFRDIHDFLKSIPKKPAAKAFAKIAQILDQPWQQHESRTHDFKLKFEAETNMSTSLHMMLTQENTPLGSLIETVIQSSTVKTTPTIFNMLPKTSLLRSPPYDTCSVVGSSGVLTGSKCGQLIDDMEFVFRFNLAPTIGHEQDVGNKTNMTTMNPSITRSKRFGNLHTSEQIANFTQLLSGQKGFVWTPVFGFKGYYKDSLKAIQKANGSNPDLTFILEDTKHFKAFHKFWKRFDMKRMPSTGFYIVNCALALCKNVHIFGFWPFKQTLDGQPVPYHYYDKVIGKSHDFSTELKWILSMHQFGVLKLHVGNCTDVKR